MVDQKISNFWNKNWILISGLAGLSLAILTAWLIPWHMDEFIMFHRIACSNPAQQINTYHEGCFDYKVSFLGFEYYKSYFYTGGLSSLISAPFFLLMPSLWTTYLIGFIFLFLVLLGIVKSFNLPNRLIFLGLLFFPLTFTTLHDGGPVRISLLAISWSPFLFKKYLIEKNNFKFFWILLLAGTWIAATEDKTFFVFLIPGTLLFIGAKLLLDFNSQEIYKMKKSIFFGASGISVLPIIFLLIMRAEGLPYLIYLTEYLPSTSKNFFRELISSENPIVVLINFLYLKLGFIFNWGYYPHRTMQFTSFSFNDFSISYPGMFSLKYQVASFLYFFSIALILFFLVALIKWIFSDKLKKPNSNFTSSLLLLGSTTIYWLFALAAGGETSHHFVFAFIPIIGLTILKLQGVNGRGYFVAGLTTFVSAASLAISVIVPNSWSTGPEIKKVQELAISIANENSVIAYSAWGGYSQYSLLNEKNIPIVSVNEPNEYLQLQIDMKNQRKEILNICMACDLNTVRDTFKFSKVEQIPVDNQYWQLFKVIPEK